MPKILRRLRINEVSSVTRGAGEGVQIMLMKRDDPLPYLSADKFFESSKGVKEFLDDDVLAYLKREFSAEQRRSAAESGAALPDGSFPIHNKSDLHNAMRAIGRAKDPAKAKAHIRRRAKALGLSGELSDAFKSDVPYAERVSTFFADLFSRKEDGSVVEDFDEALAGLAESVKSIIDDDTDTDKEDLLAKTFTQFHEHVSPLIGGPAPPRQPTDKKGDTIMSAQLLKALGLKDDASEEDALKAVAALIAKAKREDKDEDEDEDEDEEEEERAKEKEKALKSLPESVRKMIADGQDAIQRVKKLEADAAMVAFTKQCADIGLPESHAVTLQKAYGGDKPAIDELLKLTKTGFAAAKEAGAFKELGWGGEGGGGRTAHEQFTALATKFLKEHPGEKLTHEQAYAKLYQDPAYKDLRIQDARESGRA